MGRRRLTSIQIIAELREALVDLSRGQSVSEACRKIGVTDQMSYRWWKVCGEPIAAQRGCARSIGEPIPAAWQTRVHPLGQRAGGTAKAARQWLAQLEVQPKLIEPESPWENGCVESYHGKLRHELINREIFCTLHEAQVLIERWRMEYNQLRHH